MEFFIVSPMHSFACLRSVTVILTFAPQWSRTRLSRRISSFSALGVEVSSSGLNEKSNWNGSRFSAGCSANAGPVKKPAANAPPITAAATRWEVETVVFILFLRETTVFDRPSRDVLTRLLESRYRFIDKQYVLSMGQMGQNHGPACFFGAESG